MLDINKQIEHWSESAQEDFIAAKKLLESKMMRHSLFFAHLALEKMLKALVCKNTKDLAPKIHNLTRLAELAGTKLDPDQIDILAEMNAFSVECRYPEPSLPLPTPVEAQNYISRSEEVFRWLMNQL